MGVAGTLDKNRKDAARGLDAAAEFAAARRVFLENGYEYSAVCARLNVQRLYQYQMPPAEQLLAQPVSDSLDALIRLFCHGLRLNREITVERLTSAGRDALFATGLLEEDSQQPDMDFAPHTVLPFLDMLAMSDRFSTPDGEPLEARTDSVYPALFDNTYNFVTRIPKTPCEALLDLGTGAGAAAISQSRFARQVWATDINLRAAEFTAFNCRLNGRENITALSGDLFEPVRGLTFDRIVTQPPYTAVDQDAIAYRDGGKDGEQVFRRTVEALPEFLRPGGACYALLMATDRAGEPFEQRLRKWLGSASPEFDILVACDLTQDPAEFLRTARKIPQAEREYRRVLYHETQTTAVIYCSVLIRRKRSFSPPVSLRTFAGPALCGEDLDFYLAWNVAAAAPGGVEMLLNARPRLGRNCRMLVKHAVREGRLVPEEFELHTTGPFLTKGKTPPWVAGLVAECNGSLTWQERREFLESQGRLPASIAREDYANILTILVSSGVLEVSRESFVFPGS